MSQSTIFAGIALAIAAGIASTFALADGMPTRGKMSAAPAQPAGLNWSGLYVGGNIGGGWSDVDHNVTFTSGNSQSFNFDKDSFAGGVQFIYQGQRGNFVFGVETGVTGFNFADAKAANPAVAANSTRTSDIDWLFTLSSRLGYAVNNWLIYVKGGYAGAEIFRGTNVTSTGSQITGTNRREDGWTVGGGFEVAVSPIVSLGIDYSYVSIEPVSRLASPQFVAAGFTSGFARTSDVELHLLTARINFKLGQ